MGALPPVSSWIPEDDLLLKNAVEAGASLESLAKGAVQFSRKFSVRELQERWHSLLYDPVISAEAASLMMEFEQATLSSKLNKSGNSKDSKCIPVKRRSESVRNCYYAMRKRVRTELFDSRTGSDHYLGNGDKPLPEDCMFGNLESSRFEHQKSNMGISPRACPEADSSSAHAFGVHFQDSVPEVCLRKQECLHIETPHTVEEFSQTKESMTNNSLVQEGPELERDHVFTSPPPECDSSFQNLGCLSPFSEIPLWRTVEGISEQGIQVDSLREKDLHAGDAFLLPGDGSTKNTCAPEYDIFHHDTGIKLEISPQEVKNGNACPEGYLSKLSNSLLFTPDEILMEVDGKDDKSYYDGLSSLLLDSPKDANQGVMANITEPEASLHPDSSKSQPSTCPAENKEMGSHQCSDIGNLETQVPTVMMTVDPQFPEFKDGVICCILLTEDPEIPSNDHVVFTNHLVTKSSFPSGRGSIQDAGNPKFSSFKEVSGIQNNKECLTTAGRHIGNPGQYQPASKTVRSQVVSNIGFVHPTCADRELISGDTTHKSAGVAYGSSTANKLANAGMEPMMHVRLKEKSTVFASKRHRNHNVSCSLLEESAFGSAPCEYYPEPNASAMKRELDNLGRPHNHQVAHAKLRQTDITAPEQVASHSTSDLEELVVESEDDVPNFSDIEAMILEKELDPEEQDINSYEQVLKYQHEDTKKAIMRLEQGAQSYMQRAIASHGAFAVLYGRKSKHYIKKPVVLLGRATKDRNVDFDLGKEGHANKISRQQAIIKLDTGGSFQLENHGKCSIYVNDMEVAPGQSLDLASSCLIKIRGMAFIFEINRKCVQRHLENMIWNDEFREPKVRTAAEI